VLNPLEQIAAQVEASRAAAFAEQFRRIDEQLASIRNTESVNQQLFDSLHAELLKYRDNFLHESLQKPFIHDLVYLYDHLNGLCEQLSTAAEGKGKRSRVAQWRDNLENAIHSLVEILHRFDVKEIEPRERVDAGKFCQWLITRERRKYRLPTEAEWEYAAKGNDGRKFPWGNYDGRGDLANFADRNTVFAWSDRDIDDGYPESSPVGAFPLGASPFGIEDMAGNVWEWCLDYYEIYRPGPKVNSRGPTGGTKRVHRGGSWKSRFSSLRTTVRSSNVPGFSCNDLGFRVVCECD
jgi:formylglycine-generating enzyme required for sulfatase activity